MRVPRPTAPRSSPPVVHTLRVRHTYAAPPERVFEAWVTPALLKRWYALDESWSTPEASVDLRVGGRYRLVLQPPGREPIVESGEYLEIVPGERLVYTQDTAGGSADDERIVVTVEFVARGDTEVDGTEVDGTEVIVTETGYRRERVRDMHLAGWPRFLARLGANL